MCYKLCSVFSVFVVTVLPEDKSIGCSGGIASGEVAELSILLN